MTIALWCLFFAGLLHLISKAPVAVAQAKNPSGYDNNNPREQQAALSDWGKRALAAHQNQVESFAFFAAGVLVVTATNLNTPAVSYLAIAYIVARLAYIFCYVQNLATLRSIMWSMGFAASLALMCAPAWAS